MKKIIFLMALLSCFYTIYGHAIEVENSNLVVFKELRFNYNIYCAEGRIIKDLRPEHIHGIRLAQQYDEIYNDKRVSSPAYIRELSLKIEGGRDVLAQTANDKFVKIGTLHEEISLDILTAEKQKQCLNSGDLELITYVAHEGAVDISDDVVLISDLTELKKRCELDSIDWFNGQKANKYKLKFISIADETLIADAHFTTSNDEACVTIKTLGGGALKSIMVIPLFIFALLGGQIG